MTPTARRVLSGTAVLLTASTPLALAAPALAATGPTQHGQSPDALLGAGQRIADEGGQKVVEVDLHPTGYFPPHAVITGTQFTATDTSTDDTDVDATCTMSTDITPNDTFPGTEACQLTGLQDFNGFVIHEVAPATGFETAADQTISPVVPNAQAPRAQNADTTLSFANRGTWRPVILTKTGAGGVTLAGATYHLCAASAADNPVPLTPTATCPIGDLGVLTTDAQGKATWPYALPGTYSLVETAAPAGYRVNPPQALTFPVSTIDADPVDVAATDALTPVASPGPSASPNPSASPTPSKASPTKKKTVKVLPTTAVKPPTKLAYTGTDDALLVLVGAGLLVSGAGLAVASRRRPG